MDLIDKFLEYEYNHNLFNEEICEIKFWHFIRFKLYQNILKQVNHTGELSSTPQRSKMEKLQVMIDQVYNILFKSPLWGLKPKEVLVLNSPRRLKSGNCYECIYTDDLIKDLDLPYYVLEYPYLGKHFKPVRTKNLLYFDSVSLKRTLLRRKYMKEKKFSLRDEDLKLIENIIKDLNSIFEVDIKLDFLINEVEDVIYSYKTTFQYYNKILDNIKPKVILEVCHYEFDKLLINEVAKKKGIKVIELQHGTIDKYHVSYNFYKKMSLPNFPDYIFTFGEYWSKTSRFPIEKENIIDIGFYNFEKKQSEFRDKSEARNILFISQNTIGKELSKLALELNKKLDGQYKIIYKLHPREFQVWKVDYPELVNSGIEVIDNNDKDLYYYFSISDMQVGVYSTAVFEGIGFNVKTCIYNTFGHEYMKSLYESGCARLVDNEDEIIEELSCEKLNDINVKEKLWKSNSLENFNRKLKCIIAMKTE
ncbi:hypothetical protein [Clostridium sp. JNZ J1-5]